MEKIPMKNLVYGLGIRISRKRENLLGSLSHESSKLISEKWVITVSWPKFGSRRILSRKLELDTLQSTNHSARSNTTTDFLFLPIWVRPAEKKKFEENFCLLKLNISKSNFLILIVTQKWLCKLLFMILTVLLLSRLN